MRRKTLTLLDFYARIETSGTCWLWTGEVDHDGYGIFRATKLTTTRKAHRFAYQIAVGDLDPKLEIDHICRQRRCVNPEHLEQVSHRTNTLRGNTLPAVNAAKTSCSRGHPLTEANVFYRSGARICKQCIRMLHRRSYHRRKAVSV